MQQASFLEAVVDPDFPQLIRAVKLVQLLAHQTEETARQTLASKMKSTLLKNKQPSDRIRCTNLLNYVSLGGEGVWSLMLSETLYC